MRANSQATACHSTKTASLSFQERSAGHSRQMNGDAIQAAVAARKKSMHETIIQVYALVQNAPQCRAQGKKEEVILADLP